MKRYIANSRYVNYEGKMLPVNDGESGLQAIKRYKAQVAKEEADRLEAERIAKEEKAAQRELRRKTPKYLDDTIVITKSGKYYRLYDGYYDLHTDSIYYDGMPCDSSGKFLDLGDDGDWSVYPTEIDQKEIQKKIR